MLGQAVENRLQPRTHARVPAVTPEEAANGTDQLGHEFVSASFRVEAVDPAQPLDDVVPDQGRASFSSLQSTNCPQPRLHHVTAPAAGVSALPGRRAWTPPQSSGMDRLTGRRHLSLRSDRFLD